MKKLLYLFCASLLVLTSCSSDDNSSTTGSDTSILPKTLTDTSPSASTFPFISSTIVYNGNKIVAIKDYSWRTEYTYDGDLIVKVTDYSSRSGKDEKIYEISYTYENGKLSTCINEMFNQDTPVEFKGKDVYTYNSDGTVKRETFRINIATGQESKNSFAYVSTFVNGNLVKQVRFDAFDPNVIYSTDVYEYDSKNNPLKNVLGFNLLMDNIRLDGFGVLYSVNNVVKRTTTPGQTGLGITDPDVYQTEYVYDDNGYPTKATIYNANKEIIEGTPIGLIKEYTY